eukprot:555769-Rhodomonas_salina.1
MEGGFSEEEMAEAIETGMKAVTAICKGLRAFADKVRPPLSVGRSRCGRFGGGRFRSVWVGVEVGLGSR